MRILSHSLFSFCLLAFLLVGGTWMESRAQTPPPDKQTPTPPDKAANAVKEDDGVIRISSTLVSVPVTVTDTYGRLVRGLNQTDFTVAEDGRAQKIDKFFAEETPFNVVLLIDSSRSTVRKLGAIQKAAETFIKQLQPRDRVMVVTFDDRINVISEFTGDVRLLRNAIKAARTGYSTRLYDAINFAVTEKLASLTGRKAIVVLTDGVDTASKQATYDSVVEQLVSANIVTYAIQYETRNDGANPLNPVALPRGSSLQTPQLFLRQPDELLPAWRVGMRYSFAPSSLRWQPDITWQPTNKLVQGQPETLITTPRTGTTIITNAPQQQVTVRDRYLIAGEFLRTISGVSGARYLRADSIENTSSAFETIANELRYQYTIDYYSSNNARDGKFRAINVSLKQREFDVRTRQGYRAPKEDK